MPKYEYELEESLSFYPQTLLERGQNGWELCAVARRSTGDFIYYFKRVLEGVEANEWKPSIREAIDYAMKEEN